MERVRGDEGELVGSESVMAPTAAEVPWAGRFCHLIMKGVTTQWFCESRAFRSLGLDTPQPETRPTVCHTQLFNLKLEWGVGFFFL